MKARKILVVDDDSTMRGYLGEVLRRQEYDVDMAEDGKKALIKIQNNDYDLVITDIRMPVITGMDVLKKVKEVKPNCEVIMITAFGSIANAVEAIKLGAHDYLEKTHTGGGVSPDEIELKVKKVLEVKDLKDENIRLKNIVDDRFGFDNIIGKSEPMQKMFDMLKDVSESSATVFIQGPSGTGKELIAKAIHYNSPRSTRSFIKTNCAALPEGLMESELFGHEKGAFTGAIKTRMGRFEAANEGTLLLDEISEMSPG
ncbi:sigma-54-dependent transcriptional regulator, partial [candidate division KSB1 bacterium]